MKLANHTRIIEINKDYSLVTNLHSIQPYLIVSSDVASMLKRNLENLPLNYIQLLRKHHILINENEDIEVTFNKSKTLEIWLHVTNTCNFDCSYCYISKDNKSLDWITFTKIYYYIKEKIQKGKYSKLKIKFSGEEPLYQINLIRQIFTYVYKDLKKDHIKLEFAILTNGSIYSKEISKFILNNNVGLMISLDGVQEIHNQQIYTQNKLGTYQMVWGNILRYKRDGLEPMVTITITRNSVGHLNQLVRELLEKQIHFNFNFIRNKFVSMENSNETNKIFISGINNALREIKRNLPNWTLLDVLCDRVLLSTIREHCCSAGIDYYFIDHSGNVSTCQMVSREPFTNVSREGANTNNLCKPVFNNPSVKSIPRCNNCDYKYVCCGGCPLQNFRTHGTFISNSPYCSVYKKLIPKILKLEGLRILKYQGELKEIL